jgi:hypothetical protein
MDVCRLRQFLLLAPRSVWMWQTAVIIRGGCSALAGAAGRDAQGISPALISRRV